VGLAWDEALCGLDMALLLDPSDPEVRAAAEAAHQILVRLEAVPFIARLDAALARSSDPADHPSARSMASATTGTKPSEHQIELIDAGNRAFRS
jgi:hypothetical protein